MPEEKQRSKVKNDGGGIDLDAFKEQVLSDYRLAAESRQASLLGRKEVLTGKAKFGIFGDGKELAQIAMAKAFANGDWRSGYYRDQTFMMAIGAHDLEEFFAQLYGHPDIEVETHSAGRHMNAHFSTHSLNADGSWKNLMEQKNSASDIAPTSGQVPRSVGLALASKLFRENKDLHQFTRFSDNGNEVTFCTIGDAATSEGGFWEAMNAAAVQQIPLAMSVWDDGYGISVPIKYQTTKESISDALEGFRLNEKGQGMDIYRVKAWDYAALCKTYEEGIARVRETHIPALIHVQEVTQLLGHSTSGSHERYKTKERLAWEVKYDCITQMRKWIIEKKLATEDVLEVIEKESKEAVAQAKRTAWAKYCVPINASIEKLNGILDKIAAETQSKDKVAAVKTDLEKAIDPTRREVITAAHAALYIIAPESTPSKNELQDFIKAFLKEGGELYHTFLFSETDKAAVKIPEVKPVYKEDSESLQGFEILNKCFEAAFSRDPTIVAFGEDLGLIGDVNQGFAGLQEKFGEIRIFDTSIRELTIVGQGMGLAMRGLRPIAEIQYLDYLLYGIQTMSDDLATLHYRTAGRQKAPVIIRTRGHRLEGIWHTGSPMGMIIHALRGMHVMVPRNMVQAAGFYNTMLQSDDPGLIIESLNGYRLREKLPENIGEFTVPLGVPDVLQEGTDVTIVTYGSCVRVAEEAIMVLTGFGISCELIDVQTLLPFDTGHTILKSLKKTNRIVFLDEDVPGGSTSYMMEQVLEIQGGYYHLDSLPKTITASEHRTPYASDGDYFSKSTPDDVIKAVYDLIRETDPNRLPELY